LTDESLQKITENTRRVIINLYIKCETDYVNGLKIYEAIVESKILETTQNQIKSLKNEANKIIDETKKTTKPIDSHENIILPTYSETIPTTTSSSEYSSSETIPTTTSSSEYSSK
jgi:hypothetical protein